MTLLKLLTWPYVRKHLLRTWLTVAGIALGVVVFAGMHTANDTVLYGFQKTVDRIAGKAQLEVSSGETGFPEEVLEKVQALAEVDVAVPVIEATVSAGRQGNLLLLAVDMTGDRSLREYDFEEGEEAVLEDPLVFLAQPDSLIVTRDFAARNNLAAGGKLALDTMEGRRHFTVRGIMKPGGLASAFGGSLAVMDIYAAQKVLGRGRRFDRIDLTVKPGVPVDQGRAAIQKALGSGYQVERPASRGKQFESIARIFAIGATLNGMFALLIGLFIIYNTFSVAVAQRRSEIGVLRALGATQGQIRRLFLLESAVLGLAGSGLGILLGLLMARAMAGYLSDYFGEVYGIAQRTEAVAADPALLAFSVLAGVLASMLAAWIPARQAAQVDPVRALHKSAHETFSSRESRMRLAWAAIFLAVALAMVAAGGHTGLRLYVGYLSVVIAAVLLTPAMVRALIRVLRSVLQAILPVEGALAADSLLQSPRRTSATVAAVMLSLSLVVGLGGISAASYDSIFEWMSNVLNPDLFVGTSEQIAERSYRFPPALGETIRQMDFVDQVQMVRTVRVLYRQTPVMLVATDLKSLSERVRPKVVAGDARTMFVEAAQGKGVVLADNLALMQRLKLGDVIEIPSPGGVLRLAVLGITIDYSDQAGAVLMDRSLFLRNWNDDSVNLFRVYLKRGVKPEEARQRILERLGPHSRLFVMTNQELRKYVMKVTDQWFGLTYLQIFVAVLIAILGIVNSLTVSITDRRRELGVLRAVGGLRRQVRQAVWMEAAGIGAVSIVLGLALGAVVLYYYLGVVGGDLVGIRLEYRYPAGMALLLVPTMLLVALIAALGPAEAAVRASLVEALEYE